MKKNLLTMLAAIMFCGFTVTVLSACSSDNDNDAPQEQTVTMYYSVKVSDDVLKVADVEVNYVDQTGAKKKEVMISKEWKKTLDTKTLPLTEGVWAKITPKSSVVSGNYQLKLNVAAAYQAKLANGKTVYDGYAIDPEAAPTTAQTADEVAAWCAQSPTLAFTVSEEGYTKDTEVDFGGNGWKINGKDAENMFFLTAHEIACLTFYWYFDIEIDPEGCDIYYED